MKIHELKATNRKPRKRIGRGGKRGTTSGRGQKGQKSRSGHRIRPAVRDLLIRIPMLRGQGKNANKPLAPKPAVVNLEDLVKKLKAAKKTVAVIDFALLQELRFVPRRFRGTIKILGQGNIEAPFTVRGLKVSESAREKILKAGGKIE